MAITERLSEILNVLPEQTSLVAVSKFHSVSEIKEVYDAGQRLFGESRVQEFLAKYEKLPKDIVWHFIGHLQTNKVKNIVPYVDLIESVDSLRLLQEINFQGEKVNKKVNVLLQIHIAEEKTKYGFTFDECRQLLKSGSIQKMNNISIAGMMGMATFTDNHAQVRLEFSQLAEFFHEIKREFFKDSCTFKDLSMGMSDDYLIAIEQGSTMVRIGSMLFGERL